MIRYARRALVLLLAVPGALLHMLAIAFDTRWVWQANNRMVDFLHETWCRK